MRRIAWLLLLTAGACGSEDLEMGPPKASVFQTLAFEREQDDGVSVGMNLDGFVSPSNDGRTCNKEDFVGPDGTTGVDNELARLLPLIDLVGENAVEGLLQIAVDEGRLLIVLDIATAEDGSATIDVFKGADVPLLGTDGRILPGQTLALSDEAPLGQASGMIEGDVLVTAPFSLRFPVLVFTELYEVSVQDAVLRLELDDEGHVKKGLLAGGLPVEELVAVLEKAANFGQDFAELFSDAVREAGDLARDENGNCQRMSASISFDAAPTFTFR